MLNFVRKFIPNLAGIIAHLVALTKKEAGKEVTRRWRPEHDEAYASVKQLLTQAPVLQFPDFSKDFAIHVDASEAGAGAFLAQQKGDDFVITAYFSQRFNDSQRHYSATLKECYAVVIAIQQWRPYLWGRPTRRVVECRNVVVIETSAHLLAPSRRIGHGQEALTFDFSDNGPDAAKYFPRKYVIQGVQDYTSYVEFRRQRPTSYSYTRGLFPWGIHTAGITVLSFICVCA